MVPCGCSFLVIIAFVLVVDRLSMWYSGVVVAFVAVDCLSM